MATAPQQAPGSAPVTPGFTAEEIRYLKWMVRAVKAFAGSLVKEFGAPSTSNGAGASHSQASGAVASASELDSRFGDPRIRRRDPKKWAGPSYVGATYSQCPSDYLLVLADSLEYFANKDREKPDPPKHNNGHPWWEYNLKDAARARGHAIRNKGKVLPPPQPQSTETSDADEAASDFPSNADDWTPAQ